VIFKVIVFFDFFKVLVVASIFWFLLVLRVMLRICGKLRAWRRDKGEL
jgi:hypothetical protein